MPKQITKFKETEIGTIPEEWEVLELDKFAELVKDTYLPNKSEELSYVGLEHIDQQTLSLNSIGKSSDVKSNKFSFKNGDILFGKLRPYFRKVYRPKFSGICSTDIWVARAKEGFEQGWLFYLFASEDFINFASGGSGGTRMPRADWHHLKDIVWPIPKLNEQKQIAEILSSLDDKIELNRQINANLEKIASSLFKHWFVDFEFPDKNGKLYKSSGGKMIDSELGEIPEGWKIVPLGIYIKFEKGKKPKEAQEEKREGFIPQILIETFDTGKSLFADPKGSIIANKKDVLMVMDGASSGRIEFGHYGVIGSTLARINFENLITNEFLYFFLKTKEQDIKESTTGTSIPHTDKEKIKNYLFALPENSIINQFSNIVGGITDQILTNRAEIICLSGMRDSLLPRLMNGKIRMKI